MGLALFEIKINHINKKPISFNQILQKYSVRSIKKQVIILIEPKKSSYFLTVLIIIRYLN